MKCQTEWDKCHTRGYRGDEELGFCTTPLTDAYHNRDLLSAVVEAWYLAPESVIRRSGDVILVLTVLANSVAPGGVISCSARVERAPEAVLSADLLPQ